MTHHPDRTTWISYLYDDGLAACARREMDQHLKDCPACRAQLAAWRQVQDLLSTLDTTTASVPSAPRLPVIKWLALAAVLVLLGLVAGRVLLPPAPELARLRAELLPALREEVRAEFAQTLQAGLEQVASNTVVLNSAETQRWLAAYAAAMESRREQDLGNLYSAIGRVEQQRVEDYTALRKGMETVAVFTDAGLRQTREQMFQLASLRDTETPLIP